MGQPLALSSYIIPFVISVGVSAGLTVLVRRYALKRQIVDRPSLAPDRKIQRRPVPLLGGLAIFLAVSLVVFGYAMFSDRLLGGYMQSKYLIGIFLAGAFLMLGGYMDDKYMQKPGQQFVWPIIACLATIAAGIGIQYISNPLGGVLYLNQINVKVFTVNDIPYYFTLFADIFSFVWLMGMMYTTKFLDGLDGLVSGITTIGAVVMFLVSLTKDVAQPETALLSIIFAGAMLGFLFFNFNPAKIYLGEGGSLFTGYVLGVLAIISGAKVATALLIMGIPILDVIWVIIRRLLVEKKSPAAADKKHLHFRLLDVGFSHRQAVLFLYLTSLLFGGTALFLKSTEKLVAMGVMLTVMAAIAGFVVLRYRHRQRAAALTRNDKQP